MKRQRQIVVVNNEAGTRRLLEDAFGKAGFAVRSYSGASEGLADLARQAADVAVLDWYNPPLHKVELWRRLRAAHPDLTVVYVSPHAEDIAVLLAHERRPPATVDHSMMLRRGALVAEVNWLLADAAGSAGAS